MQTTAPTLTFEQALESYVKSVQAMNDAYFTKNYPDSKVVVSPNIVAEAGQRYVKVWKAEKVGTGRSIHTFVDKTNGDILKASCKAPVKNGVRGNIYNLDYVKTINHHGPEYLR
jgi:hypothetical protein